jgi:hypothetical protein
MLFCIHAGDTLRLLPHLFENNNVPEIIVIACKIPLSKTAVNFIITG